MKMITLFFINFLLVQLAIAQSDSFYDKVLSFDNCRDCYFIVVEVRSEPYSGKVLIENDNLQDYISKIENLDKAKYKEYMKEVLLNKKKLVLNNAQLDGAFLSIEKISEQKFRLLNESADVNEIASKGCIPFIKYYFLEASLDSIKNSESEDCKEFIKGLNKDLPLTKKEAGFLREQNTIINKLFEWEIPIRIDHYSGWLTIRMVDFQKTK